MLQRKKILWNWKQILKKLTQEKEEEKEICKHHLVILLQAYNLRDNFQLSNIYYMPTKCLGLCQAPRLERWLRQDLCSQ